MIKILLLLALFCNLGHAASAPEESAADPLPCGITETQLANLRAALPVGVTITFNDLFDSLSVSGGNNDNITDVIKALIAHADGLKFLDLSNNHLETLPAEFGKLSALTRLNLTWNNLVYLPTSICSLSALKDLNLSNNQLSALPVKFSNLSALRTLNLSYNALAPFPAIIGALVNLTHLYLRNNRLTILPPEIGRLINLIHLDLYQNQLTTLTPSIGSLSALRYLNLSLNWLTILPPEIGRLINLIRLNLSHNQLASVPAEIATLTNLTELNLSTNPLVAVVVPAEAHNLGYVALSQLFGDRFWFTMPAVVMSPSTTTRDQVYGPLNSTFPHLNTTAFEDLRLPTIPGTALSKPELLAVLDVVLAKFNFNNPEASNYLSFELASNDYASQLSDAQRSETVGMSDGEKNDYLINQAFLPRFVGFLKALWGIGLTAGETAGWPINAVHQASLRQALSYILRTMSAMPDNDITGPFVTLANALFHCPTGQSEGINTLAYSLLNSHSAGQSQGAAQGEMLSEWQTKLAQMLALQKDASFVNAVLSRGVNNTQNVHLISHYRTLLNRMGFNLGSAIPGYVDRLGILGTDPFNGNPYNVIEALYGLVTPARMSGWVLDCTQNSRSVALLGALRLMEARSPISSDQRISAGLGANAVVTLAQFKALIKSDNVQRFISLNDVTSLFIAQGMINVEVDGWWTEYASADPTTDEGAILTSNGALKLLELLNYVVAVDPAVAEQAALEQTRTLRAEQDEAFATSLAMDVEKERIKAAAIEAAAPEVAAAAAAAAADAETETKEQLRAARVKHYTP